MPTGGGVVSTELIFGSSRTGVLGGGIRVDTGVMLLDCWLVLFGLVGVEAMNDTLNES